MMTLKIKGKEFKVKFGYNSFCDTDLLDRVNDISRLFKDEGIEKDSDVSGIGKIKDLFLLVRELLFVGLKKHNKINTLQCVGDLLDDYMEEGTKEEPHGLLNIFFALSEELMTTGFLGDILTASESKEESAKTQDPETESETNPE